MAGYQCPMCGNAMERNLVLFLDHTQQHVIDKIKEEHPDWVESDGVCRPCADYYQKQLSGESANANIGPEGGRKRFWLGVVMVLGSAALGFLLVRGNFPRPLRFSLFVPVFLGMMGFLQKKEKTCALLAEFGLRNMDSGPKKIEDVAIVKHLKQKGRTILIQSALAATLVTLIFFFC